MAVRLRHRRGRPAPVPRPGPPVVLFLPAHDEEATVAAVVTRVPARVAGRRVECLVVDDGSGDRTAERAAAAGATVLSVPANRGLGAAVRLGLAAAVAWGRPRSPSATPTASTTWPSWSGWSPPSWKGGPTTWSAPASPARSGACCPSAASATWPSPCCCGSWPGPDRRRPERVPGPVAGGRGRRRDRPRLQLRPGAHPRPAGQGLPLPGGADRLPVPHLWPPFVRPLRYLRRVVPAVWQQPTRRRLGVGLRPTTITLRPARSPVVGRSVLDHVVGGLGGGGPGGVVEGAVGP